MRFLRFKLFKFSHLAQKMLVLANIMFSQKLIDEIRLDFVKKYRNRSVTSPFWAFLAHFDAIVKEVQEDISSGNYQMHSCELWKPPGGHETIAVYTFKDRFVIRLVTDYVKKFISASLSPHYYQKKGKGRQAAIKALIKELPAYQYVYKTDVKSYFASVDHNLLMEQLESYITSPTILKLIKQIISPKVFISGRWQTNHTGIPLGCSLSPVLAELYLLQLDKAFDQNQGIYYQRFCDDIFILAKTKWQQKRAIKKVKVILSCLKLSIRYRKTFTGHTSQTIAYLGYKIHPDSSIGISSESFKRMKLHLLRLYEQGSSLEKIRSYQRRWKSSFS